MTFIEFTTQVMKKQKQQKVEIIPVTSGSITLFDQILDMDDMIKATFDATESATKFYQIYPDIKEAFKGQDYKSIFYAYKLGYAYTGVPNDLAYVLYKSLSISILLFSEHFSILSLMQILSGFQKQASSLLRI